MLGILLVCGCDLTCCAASQYIQRSTTLSERRDRQVCIPQRKLATYLLWPELLHSFDCFVLHSSFRRNPVERACGEGAEIRSTQRHDTHLYATLRLFRKALAICLALPAALESSRLP